VAGEGLGGGDDDGPVIDIMKPGAGGTGNGRGTHGGDGLDRGASGANNETPQPLDLPAVDLPEAYRIHPPAKAVKFRVMVLPNGRAGEITMVESCGVPEIDELYQANLARVKFRPAYVAGKPVARTYDIAFGGPQ